MHLFDSQTHLDFAEFDRDRDDVLCKAKGAGVEHVIISATTGKGWDNIQHIVEQVKPEWPERYAAFGLHPMFMNEHKLEDLDKLKEVLKNTNAVAVGEIGLDFFIPVSDQDKDAQIHLFIEQLKIADIFSLPVIIHARKSLDIVLKYLRLFSNLTGSIHSFSGSQQQAEQLIEQGFYLGFGGPVTFDRATKLRNIVRQMPLEKLLIETDSPDQSDATHYGKRNEPAYLTAIAQSIAELRQLSVEDLAMATTKNAKKLFKIQ